MLAAVGNILDRAKAARESRIAAWLRNHGGPGDGDAARRAAAERAVDEADRSVQRARLAIKHPQPVLRTPNDHAEYATLPEYAPAAVA